MRGVDQAELRFHRRFDGTAGLGEGNRKPVTARGKDVSVMVGGGATNELVVEDKRPLHDVGLGVPHGRRAFDIGEQERHRP